MKISRENLRDENSRNQSQNHVLTLVRVQDPHDKIPAIPDPKCQNSSSSRSSNVHSNDSPVGNVMPQRISLRRRSQCVSCCLIQWRIVANCKHSQTYSKCHTYLQIYSTHKSNSSRWPNWILLDAKHFFYIICFKKQSHLNVYWSGVQISAHNWAGALKAKAFTKTSICIICFVSLFICLHISPLIYSGWNKLGTI